MRSLTFRQCRDLRMGVICVDLGALVVSDKKRYAVTVGTGMCVAWTTLRKETESFRRKSNVLTAW